MLPYIPHQATGLTFNTQANIKEDLNEEHPAEEPTAALHLTVQFLFIASVSKKPLNIIILGAF